MVNLPTPQSRIEELMSAFITRDLSRVVTPQSRIEEFWYNLIKGANSLPIPQSRVEVLLKKIIENDMKETPLAQSRTEEFLIAILTGEIDNLPIPQSRSEEYLNYIATNNTVVDEDIEYINYSGTNITAHNTAEKPIRSAILSGRTLVNLIEMNNPSHLSMVENGVITLDAKEEISFPLPSIKGDTKYLVKVDVLEVSENNPNKSLSINHIELNNLFTSRLNTPFVVGEYVFTVYTYANCRKSITIRNTWNETGNISFKIAIIEYQDGMENWDIPYFTGMTSCKMPVLKATGKNLIKGIQNDSTLFDDRDVFSVRPIQNESNTIKLEEPIILNEEYTLSFNVITNNNGYLLLVPMYDDGTNGERIGNWDSVNGWTKREYNLHKNGKRMIGFTFIMSSNNNYVYVEKNTIQLEQGTVATVYEPYKSNILSTPEDVELRGIGDVRDELDCLTGEVVKHVGEVVLDGTNTPNIMFLEPNRAEGYTVFPMRISDVFPNMTANYNNNTQLISNNFNYLVGGYLNRLAGKWMCINAMYFVLSISNDELESFDIQGLNKWLSLNKTTIYYPSEKSIKTVDLSGQKVYSYDGTTHYSCSAAEGALVPTLSIDVPTNLPALVSRQRTTIESQKEQIITLEQENEQLIAQNEVQDIDISLNQDAINFMLFAPATMSLNDESRNNEGVNAMAAYLANQILKGKLDYSLVVSRYGTYKEDIDTILIAEGKQDLIK